MFFYARLFGLVQYIWVRPGAYPSGACLCCVIDSLSQYCIEGISETTGASSDVFCQSNNDNHIRISCAFYVKSMQVKHSGGLGKEHRERERDIADWGEGENVSGERERRGF